MDLTVMFFGADGDRDATSHLATYDDILAITRAADDLGFTAVWTPERHFQHVGQVFPSPAVLSAALAVTTRQIAIRAGSVVLPLHHPLRVAEDWAVVDNLSRGRAGLSVATGWHSTDFVLAPDRFAGRRQEALDGITLLRDLWAGEPVELPDGTGRRVAVLPQPRPVSPRLPLWLTSSGNPATWEDAGRLRTNVLGATIGQSRVDLVDKIRRYREAYRAAPDQRGAAPDGIVTLMAHTYVGADDAEAVRRVRAPLRTYLTSHVAQLAAVPDRDGRAGVLSARQVESLAEYAMRRYLRWGSVVGSAARCRDALCDLAELGCDEVACFVDFGLDRADILAGLRRLAELRKDLPA
ncbi:MupA/Atu3671 family FMN-dependent luciferase-like monooxygenase [Actinoplanes sp. NPDC026623]|uniref:MupA/Atu3671 family FMN-dependent luciferase-like monooxygenase n=1 Tax=Actinoplanes sp. NPDC026623 TaxID=3155610 RepID=UPI0033D05464